MSKSGGRFDFDDGGSYSGGWRDGKADGYGVCTGPKGQGEYAGAWVRGFEESGVYTWPSGNTYSGEWQDGKRHGVGVEIKGHWAYRGEWSQGYKGRYGIRQSTISCARYEGTWTTNFQDGYGVETYIDEGTYQGQWQRGMRHGFGVRQSAPFGIAAQYRDGDHLHGSLPTSINHHEASSTESQRGRSPNQAAAMTDRHRGGFVLTGKSTHGAGFSEAEHLRSRSSSMGRSFADRFRLRRGQSTGDLPRTVQLQHQQLAPGSKNGARNGPGGALGGSGDTGHGLLATNVDLAEADVVETYMGEWKADKRSGFGVSERSDGLKYVGEWYNDKKHGYGITTLKDGTKEEGKYKDNELITSGRKRKLFAISKTRLRDRVDAAVVSATRAAEVAQQKGLIAVTRKANAKQKAESADKAAMKALVDSDFAREEAIKYEQQEPETSKVPVGQGTRVRMLPDQNDRINFQQQNQGVGGENVTPGKSSRLLPPRQESSDSYTSNQSSSVGSSSVPTSPPPPKPPRFPLSADDVQVVHGPRSPTVEIFTTRGPDATSRSEAPIVSRTIPQLLHATRTDARVEHRPLNQTRSSNAAADEASRTGYEPRPAATTTTRTDRDAAYANSNQTNIDVRLNSIRNFRASSQTERSSGNSFKDFSDSAESGGRLGQGLSRTRPNRDPTSPQIVLYPPTPLRRHNSQTAEKTGVYATSEGYRSQDDSGSAESRNAFSPVLSDRRYQQPVSQELSSNTRTSRGHEYATQQPVLSISSSGRDETPRPNRPPSANDFQQHQPLTSSSSNARIPTPHFINTRPVNSPHNQYPQEYQDITAVRSRPTSINRSEEQHRLGGGGGGGVTHSGNPLTSSIHSLRRRGTLPSIVHYPQTLPTAFSRGQGGHQDPDNRRSTPHEAYIVENGVRRRVLTAQPDVTFEGWETPAMEKKPAVVLQRFTLEPSGGLSKHGIKSSLPDVYKIRETTATIPREQVFALSQQRRDELRKQREDMERGTVIIRLADVTAWCKENQLILLLVALNLSLAAMFLSFLTQNNDSKSKS